MSTPVKHLPPGELLNGKIGETWRDNAQAFIDSVDFAAHRTLGAPTFYQLLPEKVTNALKVKSAVEAEEIVGYVARNAALLGLTSPQAKVHLERCQAMVRQIPIVDRSREGSYSLTK